MFGSERGPGALLTVSRAASLLGDDGHLDSVSRRDAFMCWSAGNQHFHQPSGTVELWKVVVVIFKSGMRLGLHPGDLDPVAHVLFASGYRASMELCTRFYFCAWESGKVTGPVAS